MGDGPLAFSPRAKIGVQKNEQGLALLELWTPMMFAAIQRDAAFFGLMPGLVSSRDLDRIGS
jgi:hypothetical protein